MQGAAEGWILLSDHTAGIRWGYESALRMRVASPFQDSTRRGWDLEARVDRVLVGLFVARW
jgi:hypothetical protein